MEVSRGVLIPRFREGDVWGCGGVGVCVCVWVSMYVVGVGVVCMRWWLVVSMYCVIYVCSCVVGVLDARGGVWRRACSEVPGREAVSKHSISRLRMASASVCRACVGVCGCDVRVCVRGVCACVWVGMCGVRVRVYVRAAGVQVWVYVRWYTDRMWMSIRQVTYTAL